MKVSLNINSYLLVNFLRIHVLLVLCAAICALEVYLKCSLKQDFLCSPKWIQVFRLRLEVQLQCGILQWDFVVSLSHISRVKEESILFSVIMVGNLITVLHFASTSCSKWNMGKLSNFSRVCQPRKKSTIQNHILP